MLHRNSEDRKNSLFVQLLTCIKCTRLPVCGGTTAICFTTSVLDHIVYHSNKYTSECLGEKFSTWQQITVDELLAYMGFMILMGIVQLPAIQDYWKTTSIFHYMPVAGRISRTWFFELHRYVHFADNSTCTLSPPGSPGYDSLGKIAPISDMLSA